MAEWVKLLFVSENSCQYRNVLGNVDIWRIPRLPKPSREGLGTSSIETYHRRSVSVDNRQFDVFSLEGLSDKEILKSIQNSLTNHSVKPKSQGKVKEK
jgi:hypothetical protein